MAGSTEYAILHHPKSRTPIAIDACGAREFVADKFSIIFYNLHFVLHLRDPLSFEIKLYMYLYVSFVSSNIMFETN